MKQILYILCVVFVVTLLSGCNKDSICGSGIVVTLSNSDDPINDITVWAFGSDSNLQAEYYFSSPQEASSTLIELPNGKYSIVAVTNIGDSFSHNAVKGKTTLSELLITINDASSSPAHSHYGVGEAVMQAGSLSYAQISLNRSMAEMSFTLNNIPVEVVSASMKIKNNSKGYYPVIGKLHTEVSGVDFGTIKPQNGRLNFATRRLMPVVAMQTRSEEIKTLLEMTFKYSNGGELTFDIETPALQNGGKYTPSVEYSILRPGITIEINSINGWKELPPIIGEILNPNN